MSPYETSYPLMEFLTSQLLLIHHNTMAIPDAVIDTLLRLFYLSYLMLKCH